MELFKITNHEKIQYTSYLMSVDAKVWWQAFCDICQMDTMTQAEF